MACCIFYNSILCDNTRVIRSTVFRYWYSMPHHHKRFQSRSQRCHLEYMRLKSFYLKASTRFLKTCLFKKVQSVRFNLSSHITNLQKKKKLCFIDTCTELPNVFNSKKRCSIILRLSYRDKWTRVHFHIKKF